MATEEDCAAACELQHRLMGCMAGQDVAIAIVALSLTLTEVLKHAVDAENAIGALGDFIEHTSGCLRDHFGAAGGLQ